MATTTVIDQSNGQTRMQVSDEDFVHVGPGTLMGTYLRSWWHPISVASDLPIGRPRPIRILGENFTLYRGESGQPHILGFRCAHRGNQLSLSWVEGDSLRCYYHGWRYDENGQCDRQPHEEHSFCDRIKIPSYPCQEYLGLIFGYFGPQPAPALPRYPMMEREGHVVDATVKVLPYNWFQTLENNVDPGHVLFVHRRYHHFPYIENADDIPAMKVIAAETEFGVQTESEIEGARGTRHFVLWPNVHCITIAPRRGSQSAEARAHYSWRTPVDDENTLWFNAAAEREDEVPLAVSALEPDIQGYAERVLAGEESIHDLQRSEWVTNIQDYVSQWGQGTVAERSTDHLGSSDVGVSLLRVIYRRELQALAEGRPLKEWGGAETALSIPAGSY